MDDERLTQEHGRPEAWPSPDYESPLKGQEWPGRGRGWTVQRWLDLVSAEATRGLLREPRERGREP